jgi:hypothetical protein
MPRPTLDKLANARLTISLLSSLSNARPARMALNRRSPRGRTTLSGRAANREGVEFMFPTAHLISASGDFAGILVGGRDEPFDPFLVLCGCQCFQRRPWTMKNFVVEK